MTRSSSTGTAVRSWLVEASSFFLRPRKVLTRSALKHWRLDLVAGLTVAVVLLPQAIAYAMIAELPPQTGLYAAILAAIGGALWGCSWHLHSGPTNAISMLVLASLLTVAQPGSPEFLVAAGYMAILVGVMKVLMGLLRLGVLVNFVADSLVVGFTAGAGILISFNQLRHLLRLDISSHPELMLTVRSLVDRITEAHMISLALGVGTMAAIVAIKRWRPAWPAALLGMILAATITALLNLDEQGVIVLGAFPRSLPPLAHLPLLSPALLWKLAAGALAVAAIGQVEAMSSARNIAAQSGQRLDSNQEFVGQGMANILSGLFSGYPVSGSFTRSTLNFRSGGRTPWAGVFSALWVLGAMLLLAPLAVYLPRSALAGVLLVTAWQMVDRREMRKVLRTSLGDSSIMIATLLATLLLPLEFAVLAGMLVSFARYLIKSSSPGVYSVVPDENFRHFVRAGGATVCPQLGVMEIEGSLYFGAVHHVEEAIRANQDAHPRQHFLLLRTHMIDHCDVSGIHMLESVVKRYRKRGGDVFMEGVRPGVRHMIHLYGFDRMIGFENIINTDNAIGHLFHNVLHPGFCVYECKEKVFAECQSLPKDSHTAQLPDQTQLPDHQIAQLTPRQLKELLDDPQRPVQLIDVGESGEYRNWHIHGAQSLPLRHLLDDTPDLPRDQALVFISRIGRRSTLAVQVMLSRGYEQVYNLKGGMLAWEAAGLPIDVE